MTKLLLALVPIILWLGFIVGTAAAWLTHVIHCIQTQEWVFLIAGALAFPVAVIHGIGIWFGLW
ncbi:hypothetical protein HOU03_gp484 [Caulobacter phage CcrSC]|uniref:Uncharacterized protein n=1 Tax=Caulobacter phage CcrSC TaxID=2283272 RepID=A0A385EDD4_9CAUD|nr:hypothetical protein HOU03_gp484 [Caulobacter phage CcrSC]AXQ69783.1 hypothetical protein CcrSC_gp201 [Caulobacter phage CcrSC]